MQKYDDTERESERQGRKRNIWAFNKFGNIGKYAREGAHTHLDFACGQHGADVETCSPDVHGGALEARHWGIQAGRREPAATC
jgi:hypothetical protein